MTRDFRNNALLNGLQLPQEVSDGTEDPQIEGLTPEQEAQGDEHLKEAIKRKIREKQGG